MFDPGSDPVLEDIADWLHERLNELSPGCVAKTTALTGANSRDFLLDSQPMTAYPLLAIHQESAEGEALEQATAGIEYIVPVTMQNKGASFVWIQKAIALALREYHDKQLASGGSLTLKNPPNFSANQDVVGKGSAIFLRVSVRFEYWDWAEVS